MSSSVIELANSLTRVMISGEQRHLSADFFGNGTEISSAAPPCQRIWRMACLGTSDIFTAMSFISKRRIRLRSFGFVDFAFHNRGKSLAGLWPFASSDFLRECFSWKEIRIG